MKRSAEGVRDAEEVTEAPTKVRMGAGAVFNTSMLKYYYQNFFPFRQMFQWLSYGNGMLAW